MYTFIILFSLTYFSLFVAHQTVYSDFPVFYAAAKTMLDPEAAKNSVYDINLVERYPVPEPSQKENVFIYSMPIAYLLAPLALMPYFPAKATFIFINIALYVVAIVLILRRNDSSGRWFSYPLLLSWAWLPFAQGIRGGQVDAIIFFLVSLAVFYTTKNRHGLSAFLLAFAALFKLFPLAIAVVLGVKNWRIPVYCSLFFCASLLIPGSLQWFSSIRNIYTADFMPTYLLLKQGSLFWAGLFYAGAIGGYTAAIAYRFRNADVFLIVSFVIPAVFLIMPIVEYHHLTLLIFSYVFLFNSSNKHTRWFSLIALLSFVLIDAALFISSQSYLLIMPLASKILLTLGLLMSWSMTAWKIHSLEKRSMSSQEQTRFEHR
jgi:hypothetical protein